MTSQPSPGAAPGTPPTTFLPVLGWLALMIVATAVAIALPARALVPLLLLGLFVGGVTRVGIWVVGNRSGAAATATAARAGAGATATGLGVAGLTLLVGPATPDVLAGAILVTGLYLALTRIGLFLGRP
ncbi:hypothetical protein [Pseudonocardia sp. KRD291]|uniref:hypothetical protein n=1 Tax=Pseudonocardia sp. KRD291 TaxID=2792007 RepID=UPI001C49FDE7|nr:hypothetical protein [Pseudonocardia sp. KRD291]MBW0102603.1 hypothetical protein [Pseudonocardia sp. KRD291]